MLLLFARAQNKKRRENPSLALSFRISLSVSCSVLYTKTLVAMVSPSNKKWATRNPKEQRSISCARHTTENEGSARATNLQIRILLPMMQSYGRCKTMSQSRLCFFSDHNHLLFDSNASKVRSVIDTKLSRHVNRTNVFHFHCVAAAVLRSSVHHPYREIQRNQ